MDVAVERLVDSLLYEGYALYPYTPGAAKNATPTPFGIVYPPAYAELAPSTFDRARVECVVAADADAELAGTVRFLQVAGERHEGAERRLELPVATLGELLAGGGEPVEFEFDGECRVRGRVRMRAEPVDEPGLAKVMLCVHNSTELEPEEAAEMDRAEALRASLLSTHIVATVAGGRFVSPLERDGLAGAAVARCLSENTWPVIASADADAVLGAPIVLPDNPRMAPESLGNLFDNTEIEEALLLHVHALSDGEREEIAAQDPAVREMVERAAATTPEEIIGLHGRLEATDPGPPPEPGHPNPGEDEISVEGQTLRKGAKVVLRPSGDRDVYDAMLEGRMATIERIYVDYDDAVHVAVTVDGSAEQELFRETGRYLFFKPGEVEAALTGSDVRERQILVAGVGNAWLRDDGFGGEVAKRLLEGELPAGVTVLDFGTGGLDLAYEVMRGYDALVLVDVSRQGGEAGTLYVIEPDPSEIEPIEDGQVVNPHGMDPRTMLRFVKTVGGWPGKVVVVACEPGEVEEMGFGLSPAVEAAADRAAGVVLEQVEELQTDAAYEGAS